MIISDKFIVANNEMCDFDNHVPAPYFRKKFNVEFNPDKAKITICGLGFYELYINGSNVTKGPLAPYMSNTDDVCYYDNYDITKHIKKGDNVIGVILGNGVRNAFGGAAWGFKTSHHRGPVTLALCTQIEGEGKSISFEADESFKTHPSPILYNDLRVGYIYDSNKEIPGWNQVDFDDTGWDNAIPGKKPKGILKECNIEPIAYFDELKPVSIEHFDKLPFLYEETEERKPIADTFKEDVYVYDFGINTAGVIKLTINGKPGQKITLKHGEHLINGKFAINSQFQFRADETFNKQVWDNTQTDTYICKGGIETFIPKFKYNGFRYVMVCGLTKEQATLDALTYVTMHSDLKERASFRCSCDVLNKLQQCARNSSLSNFFYYPTDCPHREKNGWTGDTSVSSEHLLLNLMCENSLKEYMTSVRGAQRIDGALPGIVPTGGCFYDRLNGPAWDSICVMVPYYIYKYTGDKTVISKNASLILRYLQYINTKRDKKGLVEIGLGDWIDPYKDKTGKTASPLIVTDSIMTYNIAKKAHHLFKEAGMELEGNFAHELALSMREAIRKHLIDFKTMTVLGNCQTSQCFALYTGIFDKSEEKEAGRKLLDIIHRDGDVTYLGMIGIRCIFHVLTQMGEYDLCYKMITSTHYTAYGYWIKNGATALWECFRKADAPYTNSKNHHFLGDISSWFIRKVAGLNPNPAVKDISYFEITPHFIKKLDFAEASYQSQFGKVKVKWERCDNVIKLRLLVPPNTDGKIKLPKGFKFKDNHKVFEWKKSNISETFEFDII